MLGMLHCFDELSKDFHPLLVDLIPDRGFDLRGAACSLVAKLGERVLSLEPRDCLGVDLLVPAHVLSLDKSLEL